MIMRWRTPGVKNRAAQPVGRSLLPAFIGGLASSLCCLPPALALVLGFGVGGTTFLATLGAHEGEILLIGFGLSLIASWWILRRQAKACRIDRNPLPFLLRVTGAFAAAYLATLTLAHVIMPLLARVSAGS